MFHYTNMSEQTNAFGGRLAEERRRLRLNQEGLAEIAGSTKRSIGNYERGERSPDAEMLLKFSEAGMDIYYVLMGQRITERADLDPMQRALLDDFDRCSLEGRIDAVRYVALLASGVKPAAPPKQVRKKRSA